METKIFLYNGDNINILKKNKIKPNIIYIDPPYNTWNTTLTYNDKLISVEWSDNFKNLIKEIKKQCLENSVFFISIGVKELPNVINILKRILGNNSIISVLPRRTHSGHKTSKTINLQHDFVIMAKIGSVSFNGIEIDTKSYKEKDEFFKKRGKFQLRRVDYKEFKWSKSLDSEMKIGNKYYYPGGVNKEDWIKRSSTHSLKDWSWIWSQEKINFALENKFAILKGNRLYKKTYTMAEIKKIAPKKYTIKELVRTKKINSLHFIDKKYALKTSKTEPESLFDYPKSDELIRDLILLPIFKEKIVLDPFGGTGTTAIVSNEMNIKEVHIIQRDEKTITNSLANKKGFKNIYQLTKINIETRTNKKIKEIK